MSKPEWGIKRRCAACEAPFYDVRRNPIVCPKCGAVFNPNAPTPRAAKARAVRIAGKATAPAVMAIADDDPLPAPSDEAEDEVEDEEDDLDDDAADDEAEADDAEADGGTNADDPFTEADRNG